MLSYVCARGNGSAPCSMGVQDAQTWHVPMVMLTGKWVFPQEGGKVGQAFLLKRSEQRARSPSWCRARGSRRVGVNSMVLVLVLLAYRSVVDNMRGYGSAHQWLACHSQQPLRHHEGRRRRGCLHRQRSIWQKAGEVQQIYFMGIMHNRHTKGWLFDDVEPSCVPQHRRRQGAEETGGEHT